MARKKRKAGNTNRPQPAQVRSDFQMPPAMARLAVAALTVLLLSHAAVFGWRVMSAERGLTNDSFSYIGAARNLSAGRGLVGSIPVATYGFWGEQFSPDAPSRTRFTHSILYPFLIFAVAESGGLPHSDAAFLISAMSYALALALVFLLAWRVWGAGAGALAVAAVVAVAPLRPFTPFSYAWTEPFASVLMLGALVLLAKRPNGRMFLAAGVLSGLAYMQRSGMLPLVGVGVVAVLLCPKSQNRVKSLGLFLAGASVGAIRHFAGDGVAYKLYGPSPVGFSFQLSGYLSACGVLLLVLCALTAAVFLRTNAGGGGGKNKLRILNKFFHSGEIVMLAWVAGYSFFIILSSSIFFYGGAADHRFLFPMRIVAETLVAGLAWRVLAGWRWRAALAVGVFALVLAGGIRRDAGILAEGRDVSDQARIADSELLTWANKNIAEDDFVIGSDVGSMTYYLKQVEFAHSFSPLLFTPPIAKEKLDAVVRHRCGQFRNFYLIVRHARYGPYLDGLRAGRPTANVKPLAALREGFVYRLTHCDDEKSG